MYVQTILNVHKKYDALVKTSFNQDVGFVASLDKACGRFINKNAVTVAAKSSSKSPELLARLVVLSFIIVVFDVVRFSVIPRQLCKD